MAGSLWFCVKGYSRLQTVVALSSAEAELFAIAEAAKEIAGLGQLASHIWGELTKPLAIYTDSASARQIAGMEGFLRRMRHVDIRLCFIQEASRLIFCEWWALAWTWFGFCSGHLGSSPRFSLCFPSSFGPCEAGGVVCRQLLQELVAP